MTVLFTRAYGLVPRGGAGLACDDDGVALGPLPLVEAVGDASGRRPYRMRPIEEIAQAAPDAIERYPHGLAQIVQLLRPVRMRKRASKRCCWLLQRSPLKPWRNSHKPRRCKRPIPIGPTSRAILQPWGRSVDER